MNTASTDDLIRWLDSGDELLLVDVLERGRFDEKHIPGAVNVPASADDFAQRVARHADGDKKKKVVVYCANEACNASPAAARKLEKAGFKRVFDYEAGIEAYENAGRPLVGVQESR
jgi:rhodanese-related sulfurtransferase